MWPRYNQFLRLKIVWITLTLSLLLNLAVWFLLLLNYQAGAEKIILHYNYYYGVDLIGTWLEAFLLPFLGLFTIAFNLVLAQWQFARNLMVSYFFLLANPILNLLLFFAILFILQVNNPLTI